MVDEYRTEETVSGVRREHPGPQSPRASRRSVLRGATAVCVAGLAGCTESEPKTGEHPKPEVIGHRGCAAENPENTVAAVEAAAAVADAVEVDVRRCSTGELVVFHDESLDRLTDETGRVDETPCETILDLEIGDSGESIPTLREVFEAVPPEKRLVLDLKEPGLADGVLRLRQEYEHDLLLSSFLPEVLREVRAADETVPTAYIVRESRPNRLLRPLIPGAPVWLYGPENLTEVLEETVELGCDAIHPRYELCLRTDIVSRAHAVGLRVEPWTTRTEREFEALRAVGVDAVISDICRGLVG